MCNTWGEVLNKHRDMEQALKEKGKDKAMEEPQIPDNNIELSN